MNQKHSHSGGLLLQLKTAIPVLLPLPGIRTTVLEVTIDPNSILLLDLIENFFFKLSEETILKLQIIFKINDLTFAGELFIKPRGMPDVQIRLSI